MTRVKPTRQAQVARLAEELRHISKNLYPAAGDYDESRVAVIAELRREIERLHEAGE